MNDDEQKKLKSEADARTFAALVMMIVVAHSLLGVMALVLPQLLGVVLIVAGFVWFAVMHYVLWGWWLSGYLQRQAERDAQEERE